MLGPGRPAGLGPDHRTGSGSGAAGDAPGVVALPFSDRRAAGTLLGRRLAADRVGPGAAAGVRTLVLALPRGGVVVAAEVARLLRSPLDVLVTRKLGYPQQPELGVGAIAEGGEPVYDEGLLRRLGLKPADLAAVVARERAELERRVRVYRRGRPPPDVSGRLVVLVDDGLATGVTARAALRSLRRHGAARTVLAVPVAAGPSAADMLAEADEVVVLACPAAFRSVGEWYAEFGQLADADVLAVLAAAGGGEDRAPRP